MPTQPLNQLMMDPSQQQQMYQQQHLYAGADPSGVNATGQGANGAQQQNAYSMSMNLGTIPQAQAMYAQTPPGTPVQFAQPMPHQMQPGHGVMHQQTSQSYGPRHQLQPGGYAGINNNHILQSGFGGDQRSLMLPATKSKK